MKWIAKAVVQKLISWMPFKVKINFLMQKYITKGYVLDDEHYNHKKGHALDHLQNILTYLHKDIKEATILEIGSGWYPIVPILLSLHGAKQIVTVDLYPHLTLQSMKIALQKMSEDRELNWNQQQQELLTRCMNSSQLQTILDILRIKYHVGDITRVDTSSSFEVITSNNTFEHIHRSALEGIMSYFFNVLKDEGIMSHFIDMSDHFSHFDQSIGPYNFLKYSNSFWRKLDNSIQPQNRMRLIEHEELHTRAGFEIIDKQIWDHDPRGLEEVEVHSDFAHIAEEQLAILHAYLISRKRLPSNDEVL